MKLISNCLALVIVIGFSTQVWANVSHALLVLNYSINFLLYCVGNSNVRKEAFRMLFRCKNIYWSDWQTGRTVGKDQ